MGYAIVRDNTKTVTKSEVEKKLASVGDYVKMDFLAQCLKKNLDFDTKKFVLMKLAEIYESRKMFSEAAKVMRGGAEINATYESKLNDFVRSGVLFVKGGAEIFVGTPEKVLRFRQVYGYSYQVFQIPLNELQQALPESVYLIVKPATPDSTVTVWGPFIK